MAQSKTLYLSSWGNNNGHIIHCLALARHAARAGWRVVVGTQNNDSHVALVKRSGYEVVIYPDQAIPDDLWLCWHDEQFFQAAVELDLATMEKIRADAVVHDIRMSVPIAAAALGIGCAAVCHQPDLLGFRYPGLDTMELWQDTTAVNSTLAGVSDGLCKGVADTLA